MNFSRLEVIRGLSLAQLRELLRFALRRLKEERLPQVAGSLTFTTVLALVPVLTIAMAIFTTFPLFHTFRASLEAYFIQNLMPKGIANTILGYLNQFSSQAKRLSALGAVALIATAVTMLAMIDKSFNRIWRVRRSRPLPQRILIYWAAVTLGPLLIGISITVTAYLFSATTGAVGYAPTLGGVFNTLLSLALTSGAFTLLYMAVPNRLVDWRDAACGGALAAIAFELTKRLFAVFVAKFPTYTVVYGALAAVPIFLVWIYLGWFITLMGAVVVAALPVVRHERWWHVATPGSAFVDAMALLGLLYEARALGNSAIVDTRSMRSRTRIGFDEAENLLEKMLDAGWVGRIKEESTRRVQFGKRAAEGRNRWVLLANPDKLTLADVYRMFVFDVADEAPLARQVEHAVELGLGQTLTMHFETLTLGNPSAPANGEQPRLQSI